MGSQGKTNIAKPHYNISMSKRTRKSQNLKIEPRESFEENKDWSKHMQEEKISLKELIGGRCSLAQRFREEEGNQQGVVIKPSSNEDGFRGMISKKFTRNYAKLLGHLIKVNQESCFRSWRKAAPSFKFIKHK
ncbi:hypothetical protein PHJA_001285200 [Phtheirospermum japonicum]|uniref:Uncharacterized protein n=1 Tax=Phtheirospermum japonicum TaxID=374723 RepID=A0A830BZU8_9LAMI|nr:hypothetical protein PHJA_001285200 [Phtheirospermum japonicum]